MNKPEIRTEQKKMTKQDLVKQIAKMRERDSELVTGIFKNLECPASSVSSGVVQFGYKMYPGDTLEFYEFRDGEKYRIPRGVARHLNNNCYYTEYKHMDGQFGESGIRAGNADGRLRQTSTRMQITKKIHRYAFHSLEFMDDDMDLKQSNLVEVTATI